MTKINHNIITILDAMHSLGSIWDISNAYNYAINNGYDKSKRSFERDLININFVPNNLFEKDNINLKKTIYNFLEEKVKSKRQLSLTSSVLEFNERYFIFYEDKRGKKYWHGLSDLCTSDILNSTSKILEYINQTAIIWPSNQLIELYSLIVKNIGTETVINNKSGKIRFPMSSFKKLLKKDDLSQLNYHDEVKKIGTNHDVLSHLEKIESEAIHIIRETVAEAENPVMLYSVGKDSAVMLHLAKKAFYPAKPPLKVLHIDTTWKFKEMIAFRDYQAKKFGLDLIVHTNPRGAKEDITPFGLNRKTYTDIMKTEALRQALDHHGFDMALGGARRDEEKSRAKERIFSFRTSKHRWDPKNQRPELWNIFNGMTSVKLDYLSVPILLNYRMGGGFISLQAGPQYRVLIDKNNSILQNTGNAFRNGDLSLLGGVQLKAGAFRINGRYFVGLSNINDITNDSKWKNQGFQLSVGLTFF